MAFSKFLMIIFLLYDLKILSANEKSISYCAEYGRSDANDPDRRAKHIFIGNKCHAEIEHCTKY